MNAAIALLKSDLAQQPDLTSTTPGPACPLCGRKYIIAHGRRSHRWLVLHPGSGPARDCPEYKTRHPSSETQDAAIAVAMNINARVINEP